MAQDKNKQLQNKGGIKIAKDGPYLVFGSLPLKKEIIVADENGDSSAWGKGKEYPRQEKYALCRCGHSKNKPFCDGDHAKIGFDGTETASKENYSDQCEKISGPELDLADVPDLCARARFCHNQYNDVWSNTQGSDDPDLKKNAVKQACNCPSGRLVAINKKTGEPIEPGFEQSISLVEDPAKKVSGPIWAKGGGIYRIGGWDKVRGQEPCYLVPLRQIPQ